MIRLTCTHCQKVLSVDEAFAGGVCRCRHCGTIQTVPKGGGEAAPPPAKALYRTGPAPEAAEAPIAQEPEPAAITAGDRSLWWLIAAVALLAGLIGLFLWHLAG
jgi:hypothetical protein